MNTHRFSLIGCKLIFCLEDILPDEKQLWINYLKYAGFSIKDHREIFLPFQGEQITYFNPSTGTKKLRIRIWNWIDCDNIQHKILDINSWTGNDKEFGVIAVDEKAAIDNTDQNLLVDFDQYVLEDPFNEWIDIFAKIRIYDEYNNEDVDENIIELETASRSNYQNKLNRIKEEQVRLSNKYLSEFTFIEQIPFRKVNSYDINLHNVFKISRRIGYELTYLHGEYDSRAFFIFVQWHDYKLVTIFENYDNKTYLLNSKGKIDIQIYHNNYIFNNYDKITDKLAKRIHSYLTIIYNSTYINL